jgi:hypothetical protein
MKSESNPSTYDCPKGWAQKKIRLPKTISVINPDPRGRFGDLLTEGKGGQVAWCERKAILCQIHTNTSRPAPIHDTYEPAHHVQLLSARTGA